jgi:hypothetical protein
VKTWLKMLGSGDHAMAETIVPQVLRLLRFPRRPSVSVGDKLVLYALGHDRAFAIVEAFSPIRPGEGDNPWDKWFLDVREVMSTSYAAAPRLSQLSVAGRSLGESIGRHSHIQLRADEYDRAVTLLREAGAAEDRLYRAY